MKFELKNISNTAIYECSVNSKDVFGRGNGGKGC